MVGPFPPTAAYKIASNLNIRLAISGLGNNYVVVEMERPAGREKPGDGVFHRARHIRRGRLLPQVVLHPALHLQRCQHYLLRVQMDGGST